MEIRVLKAVLPKEIRTYRKFVEEHYSGDQGWVSSSLFLLDIFLNRKDHFCREATIQPLLVYRGNQIVAQCILVFHPSLDVQQVAFFEALPDSHEGVRLLLQTAKIEARHNGCKELVVGLNGHLAYGVGIMTEGWGRATSFDSLYHKPYYADYFRSLGMQEHSLCTYQFEPAKIQNRFGSLSRAYRDFQFRKMNQNKWQEEVELFGDLANKCLSHTRYYFDRPSTQLYELVKEMKFFMKPEFLIFVLKDNVEVGFIFWHPDFNEALIPGKKHSIVSFGLRHLLRRKQYETVKVNAIGVLPEYRKTGASIGLFMTALGYAGLKYKRGETNFVWDCNDDSRQFNLKLGATVDRRYSVFTECLQGIYE